MEKIDKYLVVDESGNHKMPVTDSQYPVFALGGGIVGFDYANGILTDEFNKFKLEVLGRQDFIIHTADIVRNRNGFEKLENNIERENFYEKLNGLMGRLDYSVLACAIHKEKYKKFVSPEKLETLDPYILSFSILVERFALHLARSNETGIIIAERRDPVLDRKLKEAWENIKISGTANASPSIIAKHIVGLELRGKKENLAGLQLADLIISPIGRHVLGKPEKQDMRIIRSKFLTNPVTKNQEGLIILP